MENPPFNTVHPKEHKVPGPMVDRGDDQEVCLNERESLNT